MAPCVGDFPWSSDRQNKRGDGDANIFFDIKDGVPSRSPAPNAATVREPWSAAPTSVEVLRNASASFHVSAAS
jgi:hypothetical protein